MELLGWFNNVSSLITQSAPRRPPPLQEEGFHHVQGQKENNILKNLKEVDTLEQHLKKNVVQHLKELDSVEGALVELDNEEGALEFLGNVMESVVKVPHMQENMKELDNAHVFLQHEQDRHHPYFGVLFPLL